MDVKQYYRKLREIEGALGDTYPVIVSLETTDGGKKGLLSEVPRAIAAKVILEGRAVLASDAEKAEFREQQAAAKLTAEKNEMAKKIQVTLVGDPNLQAAIAQRQLLDATKNGK